MSDVNNVNGTGNAFLDLNNKADKSKSAAQEQSDMFMKLMIAQMKNQDPSSPADTADYMNQISQMSMVESVNNMALEMQSLSSSMMSSQSALQASSMVGKTVYVPTDTAVVGANGFLQGVLDLPASAPDVRLEIYGPNGDKVDSISMGAQAAGDQEFAWAAPDGSPTGEYTVKASTQQGDEYVPIQTYLGRNVDSVTLGQNGVGMKINIQGDSVTMDQVKQIGV